MQELVTIKANIDTLMGYTEPGRKQERSVKVMKIRSKATLTLRAMLARGSERRYLLEIVQGYAILKTTTFDSGHGFALGHNPGAPDPL